MSTPEGSADRPRWTDSHCHLHFPRRSNGPSTSSTSSTSAGESNADDAVDRAGEAVAAARLSDVDRLITVGCDVADSAAAIAVAAAHDGVWATAGVHPHEAAGGVDGLEALFGRPGVVAVGECGLDYHYDHSPRDAQREVFAEQIALARAHDLALVIHTREAWDDTFDVLAAEGVPERTVFHCFTGGPDEARRSLDAGGHLSFSGIVSFKTASDVRAAAAVCPLDRLLVETDAPFLAPVPHRGETNQPAFVPVVGAAVAEARGDAVGVVASASWANASRLFRLD